MTQAEQKALFMEAFDAGRAYDLAMHEETMDRLHRGDITAVELYAAFANFSARQAEIEAELSRTHTIPQLKRKLVWPSGKKAKLVSAVYSNMLGAYAAPSTDVIGYSPFAGETYAGAIDKVVANITDEQVAAYAAEYKAKTAAFVKSLTNPETLEEFETFVYRRGQEPLTDEQLVVYDGLMWRKNREHREKLVLAAIGRERRETQALTEEAAGLLKIREDWHSKRQCDVWVVGLTERIDDKDTFRALSAQARQFRARWSRYGQAEDHGWIFWSEGDALAFMKLAGGEEVDMEARRAEYEAFKQARAADRLAEYATYHVEAADASLMADRLTNTWRRVQMARNAEDDARMWKRFAQIVGNVALAMELGELEALADVRYGTQVALLVSLLDESWRNATRWENENQHVRPQDRRPFKIEDIRHALLPLPRLDVRETATVAANLKGKRGVGLAKRILLDGVKRAREADRHWMTLQVSEVGEVLSALPKSGIPEFNERFADWKRLVSVGLATDEELRHALRELHRYVVEAAKPDPIREAIRELVGRKIPGFFPTQRLVLRILEDWLPCPGPAADGLPMSICEPQAGIGNILDWLVANYPEAHFTSHEINWNLVDILRMKGHTTVVADYLTTETVPCFDLIVANPPFEDGQDIEHFYHSLAQLKEGGRLIYIMFESSFTRKTGKAPAFQAFVKEFATHTEKLPARSFHESGTDVATRFVVFDADNLRLKRLTDPQPRRTK